MSRTAEKAAERFVVLLGPDYAGKSSVMSALSTSSPWEVVSVDDDKLSAEHLLVSRMRHQLVSDVLPALGTAYSAEFMVGMLQLAVLHLRDRVVAARGRPLVIDSYYYKILAKCRLALGTDNPMFRWWRTFPQPEAVVYLDVSAGTAWQRSGFGARANRLEHYGADAAWPTFATYQGDLRKVMLDEVSHLPVRTVDEGGDLPATVRRVREELASVLA
ncbi:hypothetical protein E1258_24820 [Micromonospora sp. KC207]|uniref:dTMP kinase n=1 Tax=Micromonospora sp. KC207 TaxID=2530377 RepID=UPI00104D03ED|nr:hypothetical protein [Micromonospora sp. KC207]TDC52889.1 hypothetical protein E1258_24820 [Micromonospora sp. KC207]